MSKNVSVFRHILNSAAKLSVRLCGREYKKHWRGRFFAAGLTLFSGRRRGVAFSENGIFMLFDGGLPRVLVPAVLNFLQMKGR